MSLPEVAGNLYWFYPVTRLMRGFYLLFVVLFCFCLFCLVLSNLIPSPFPSPKIIILLLTINKKKKKNFTAKYHFINEESVEAISQSCKKNPTSLIIHGDVDTIVPHVCCYGVVEKGEGGGKGRRGRGG